MPKLLSKGMKNFWLIWAVGSVVTVVAVIWLMRQGKDEEAVLLAFVSPFPAVGWP